METAIVIHSERFYLECLIAVLREHYPALDIRGMNHSEDLLQDDDALPSDMILIFSPQDLAPLKHISAIRQLTPRSKLILIAYQIPDIRIADVIRQGADGYLSSQSGLPTLYLAISEVEQNRRYIDPHLITYEQLRKTVAEDLVELTPRERETLEHLVRGGTNKMIAHAMVSRAGGHITEQTVKTYVSNILMKLQVTSRQEAIVMAIQKQLVPFVNPWENPTPTKERV